MRRIAARFVTAAGLRTAHDGWANVRRYHAGTDETTMPAMLDQHRVGASEALPTGRTERDRDSGPQVRAARRQGRARAASRRPRRVCRYFRFRHSGLRSRAA